MDKQGNEFLTVQELADLLRVRPATIYRQADAGQIPHVRIGRAIRFNRQAVEAHLAREMATVEAK